MNSQHLIPIIWFRLIVVVGFAIFMGVQHKWWLLGLAVVLALITIWQLIGAYSNR